jgi:hypothetical protein
MRSLADAREKQRIVDVYFSYTNFFENEGALHGMGFVPFTVEKPVITTRYELELNVTERQGQYSLTFLYSTDLYDPQTIGIFLSYYRNLMAAVLADDHLAIESIPLEAAEASQV